MTLTEWQQHRDPARLPNLVRVCVAADALGVGIDKLAALIESGALITAPARAARADFVQYPSLAHLARLDDIATRQTRFDALPLLLPAGRFADWAGVNVSTVHRWVNQGHLTLCIPPGNIQGMHYKSELARITGYKF